MTSPDGVAFEPFGRPAALDRGGPGSGVGRRRWVVVSLVALVAVAAAVALGLVRAPTYSATSRLVVGSGVAVPARSGFGSLEDAPGLAATYSRAVTAEAVLGPVGRASGLSREELLLRVSASPVPESPVFVVTATGPSEAAAVDLANRTTDQLVAWIVRVTDVRRTTAELRDQIEAAAQTATDADARVARAAAAGTPDSPEALQAQAEALAARTQLDALTSIYGATVTPTPSDQPVELLNPATEATDDRLSFLQKLIVAALVAGVGLGLGLAALLDAALRRRRPRLRGHPAAHRDTSTPVPRVEA